MCTLTFRLLKENTYPAIMSSPVMCPTGQFQYLISTVLHKQSPADNIRRCALLTFKQAFHRITFHRCSVHKKRNLSKIFLNPSSVNMSRVPQNSKTSRRTHLNLLMYEKSIVMQTQSKRNVQFFLKGT